MEANNPKAFVRWKTLKTLGNAVLARNRDRSTRDLLGTNTVKHFKWEPRGELRNFHGLGVLALHLFLSKASGSPKMEAV